MQLQVQPSCRAGMLPMSVPVAPGADGATVLGTQGAGVGVPRAAAVAAATAGLDGVMHMPKVGMLTRGLWSMMLAAGGPPASVLLAGSTIRLAGATPKLHITIAAATISLGMTGVLCGQGGGLDAAA